MNPFGSRRPPIWESSKRPLYPKCVWIEPSESSSERRRHYIFDHELPIRADKSPSPVRPARFRRAVSFECGAEALPSLILVGCLSESAQDVRWTSQSGSEPISMSSVKNDESKDTKNSKAELAERVLQWLDLTGRRNRKGSERKPTRIDQRAAAQQSDKCSEQPDAAPNRKVSITNINAPISRRESLHCLSLKFDDPESEARRASTSFGELFPVTYRSARKFLSLRSSARAAPLAKTHSDCEVSVSAVRSARDARQARKKSSFLKSDQIENQYRSLIQRQILNSSCNQQLAKRQLHIFMPNLPKRDSSTPRMGSSAAASSNTVGTDSCISSELSASTIPK